MDNNLLRRELRWCSHDNVEQRNVAVRQTSCMLNSLIRGIFGNKGRSKLVLIVVVWGYPCPLSPCISLQFPLLWKIVWEWVTSSYVCQATPMDLYARFHSGTMTVCKPLRKSWNAFDNSLHISVKVRTKKKDKLFSMRELTAKAWSVWRDAFSSSLVSILHHLVSESEEQTVLRGWQTLQFSGNDFLSKAVAVFKI